MVDFAYIGKSNWLNDKYKGSLISVLCIKEGK